jgi:hypothetical protein
MFFVDAMMPGAYRLPANMQTLHIPFVRGPWLLLAHVMPLAKQAVSILSNTL